jgi:hypothetical protein
MGDCSRCGFCCTILPIAYLRDLKPGQKEYLLTHGCTIEHGTVLVPLICPHLVIEDNGKTTCDIHETKPQTCKDFDGRHLSHGRKYFIPDCCTMAKDLARKK